MAMADDNRVIAFPGAEGFGKYATGGRGGNVYYVTRNDDCSDNNLVEGTLRWALRTGDDTPRTILFKTCGTIYLTSVLKFNHANVTIEGQTAPGGGVCIAGYKFYVCMPNVILRHLRFRAGDLAAKSQPALDVENTNNVIIDHCSLTWSMEECLTMYDCDSTTVQWCIIGEGLYNSRNAKGARAYATQWGGEHSTMHHTLITNCNNRTPRFNGVRKASANPGEHDQWVDSEFFNNVIYNWGKNNSVYGGECDSTINGGDSYDRIYMRNNYYRPGPLTKEKVTSSRYFVGNSSQTVSMGQWLIDGNMFELGSQYVNTNKDCWKDATLEKVNEDNWYGFASKSSLRAVDLKDGCSQAIYDKYALTTQEVSSGLTPEPASDAYKAVVAGAGASLPRYDEVDSRLLKEAAGEQEPRYAGYESNGTLSRGMGIINSQNDVTLSRHDTFIGRYEKTSTTDYEDIEVTSWPWLGMEDGEKGILDTDGDGLPDSYETEKGLNPNDASDGAAITASGYSNLELFLNGVADGTIKKADYETEETAIKSVAVNENTSSQTRAYTLGGAHTNTNAKGVSIVQQTDGSGNTTMVKKVNK